MSTTSVVDRPLTQKQESFCLYIFQGLSQRDAYLKAGYSSKGGLAVMDTNVSRLMDDTKIALRIAELRQKAEDATIAKVVERKQILTKIQRATVADFVDEFGNLAINSKEQLRTPAVTEIRTERTLMGIKTTLKLRDPIAAIDSLNKMERIGTPDTAINISNDNRSITIVVKSEEGKRALEALRDGKLPQLQGRAE